LSQSILLERGAYLEYMPGVTIPHKHSRYATRTRIRLAPDAVYVYADVLMPGRKYYDMGELFEYDLYSSMTSAERLDGAALFTDKFVIEPSAHPLRERGVMGRFDVVGNGLLLAPMPITDGVIERIAARLERDDDVAVGATRLPNDAGLSLRVLGMESQAVKEAMREFWSAVREVVFGTVLPAEFLWR
jgi:urease accessory protein